MLDEADGVERRLVNDGEGDVNSDPTGLLSGLVAIASGFVSLLGQESPEEGARHLKEDAESRLERLPASASSQRSVSSYEGYTAQKKRSRQPGWDFSGW